MYDFRNAFYTPKFGGGGFVCLAQARVYARFVWGYGNGMLGMGREVFSCKNEYVTGVLSKMHIAVHGLFSA